MFIAIGYAFTGDLPFQMPFSPKLKSNFVFKKYSFIATMSTSTMTQVLPPDGQQVNYSCSISRHLKQTMTGGTSHVCNNLKRMLTLDLAHKRTCFFCKSNWIWSFFKGTWTGIYQAGGSLARILGPLYLTNVYTVYGPRPTFGSIIALLCGVIILNLYLFKHLIPLAHRSKKIYFDLR